jgi:hypothetical protein
MHSGVPPKITLNLITFFPVGLSVLRQVVQEGNNRIREGSAKKELEDRNMGKSEKYMKAGRGVTVEENHS